MIDAARRAAEESLLNQALVRVDQATYDYFLEILDQPANGEGFERLMTAVKPWRKKPGFAAWPAAKPGQMSVSG